ncbi:MAG: HDOD domain-containing protein [Desulfobulbaceae bacterium]|nr:MAG: HDOD domain-containing protein [Desulfobulbaceae bacterium]
MDVFVARQPILTKQKKLFGYELLFRTGMNNAFPDLDGDIATSSLLSSSFFSSGIDKISGGRKSFINFTEALLLQGTPSMFPQEKIMIEILENIKPTDEVINACRELKKKGYTLALDDFEYSSEFNKLLSIIDVVKIDFMNTSANQIDEMLGYLKPYKCRLLAEKIETYQDFERARKMGFAYFQGYFFSKPEILRNKDIPPGKMTVLRLISEINRTEFNIDKLEKLINQDVAVSYKLLKYLNSAYFARLSPLKSIRQAIAYLGERGIRLFVSLIATSQLGEDKPNELVRLSIVRARFLEKVGAHTGRDSGEMFMMGLFSLIDAMLDNPMDYLVSQLPLTEQVTEALVHRGGELAFYLELVETFETGDWQRYEEIRDEIGLDEKLASEILLDAIEFTESY